MGVFFQKKLVGSPNTYNKNKICPSRISFFNKIIVRRHTTPDTPALLIFIKTLPNGKKFVSLQRRWGVPLIGFTPSTDKDNSKIQSCKTKDITH